MIGVTKRKDGVHMNILETTELEKILVGQSRILTKALDGVNLSVEKESL